MRHAVADIRPTGELATLRMRGRPVLSSDADFYADLFGRAEIVAHRPVPCPLDRRQCTEILERDVAHWKRHGFGRWTLAHAGRTVGIGGLTVKRAFAGLNLSYHLMPEMWGQGLASEFVRAAVDHARDVLSSDTVYGLVRPSNIASIRVLEKAGFRDAGLHSIGGAPMRELRLAL